MESSRDSSIWRSLAVAFGDGLAFGVGMALSQKGGRREAPLQIETSNSSGRLEALERRLAQLENTPARLDPKAIETIVGAIENDLRARDEQWTRRLAGAVESATEAARAQAGEAGAAVRKEHTDLIDSLRSDVMADLRARDEQWAQRLAGAVESATEAARAQAGEAAEAARREHTELISSLREDVVADLHTLESQGLALQQEINESMPRLIEERIAAALELRAAEIEARLRAEIGESAEHATARAAEALDGAIEKRLAFLREALAGRDREIAGLRESLAASDRRTADLLSAIGEACREAAERGAPAQEPIPVEEAAEPPAAEAKPAAPADGGPNFAIEMRRAWNLPLVSTLLLTGGCLACLHWL